MTSEQKRHFETQWPEVAQRLSKMLARRGIPADRREDIVQETGLRLLGSWDRVDATKPLWPFTVTIALNIMRDQARRGLNTEVPSELPDRQGGDDVEASSLARLEVRRAGLALARLKPEHRDVLLAEVEPDLPTSPGSKAATKMLRMRARRKLSLMMQQVSALGITAVSPLRRLARWGHLTPYRGVPESVVTSAICGVLCVVTLGSIGSLAPFSSLDPTRDFPVHEGSGMDVGSATGSLSSPVTGTSQAAAERLAAVRELPSAGTTDSGGEQTFGNPPERESASVQQEGSYEIPLAGRPMVQGEFIVSVFTGGGTKPDPGDPPDSIDCSEHMVSPEGVNLTCWDSDNPENRYGVRVKHEGKNELRDLVPGPK